MKKNLLFFAILAFSINVFAQSKRPVNLLKNFATNAPAIEQGTVMDAALKTSGFFPGRDLSQTIRQQKSGPIQAIQVIDSIYQWQWDGNADGWKIQMKSVNRVYDNNNNLKSELLQKWTGSTWEDTLTNNYTYNNQNSLVSMFSKVWVVSVWVNHSKSINTYDGNNNLTGSEIQFWNGSTWENFMKFTFTYDAKNNNTSDLLQTGNGSVWDNLSQSTYTYDANNNQISQTDQSWNDTSTSWDFTSRHTWTYDASNKKISGLEQSYTDNAWVDYRKTSYTYTGDNLTTELQQLWAEVFWMDFGKINYFYDANNNLINELHLGFNFITWYNTEQHLYKYDANNFETGESFKYWSFGGSGILFGDSTHFYFHISATGLPEFKEADVSVYPNPTKGKFNLDSKSTINAIEIYSLSGGRIYSDYNFNQHPTKEIDLSSFAKGIYLLKAINGTKAYTRKIIIH